MDSVRQCFIANLRRVHDSSGFSRDHVAHELGIDRVTFQYWISGRFFPGTQNIEKLGRVYNVDWLEFFLPLDDGENKSGKED